MTGRSPTGQGDTTRVSVQGWLSARNSHDEWVAGASCTLQFTAHRGMWLVHGWNITSTAVLITTEQGRQIAETIGRAA